MQDTAQSLLLVKGVASRNGAVVQAGAEPVHYALLGRAVGKSIPGSLRDPSPFSVGGRDHFPSTAEVAALSADSTSLLFEQTAAVASNDSLSDPAHNNPACSSNFTESEFAWLGLLSRSCSNLLSIPVNF